MISRVSNLKPREGAVNKPIKDRTHLRRRHGDHHFQPERYVHIGGLQREHRWNALVSFFAVLLVLSFSMPARAGDQPAAADTPDQASAGPSNGTPAADPADHWHADLLMYLWLTGSHGTIGTSNRTVDYHATVGDLLSHFRFGLMGAAQVQRGRFVLINDLMWVRLRATNTATLPVAGQPELSAEVKSWELIVTPEAGYRFVDGEKIKIAALMGLRYWHVGSSLQFTPSPFGRTLSGSLNWADPLMGAQIQLPLSPKLLATIQGDAGGWGAGSQLDYQIVGTVGYRVSAKFSLAAGYRYLFVNYRYEGPVYETAMSGALVGLTYHFK
jgi:hypothetical protein